MTLAPPDRPRHGFEIRTIDMRCMARTPLVASSGHVVDTGRCQLLAGHGEDHALMFAAGGDRRVLSWSATREPHPTVVDFRSLPWMRGYPAPAWFEAETGT